MTSLQDKKIRQDDCLDQLKYTYTKLKEDYERLQAYKELLIKVLEYYKIKYPCYDLSEEIEF